MDAAEMSGGISNGLMLSVTMYAVAFVIFFVIVCLLFTLRTAQSFRCMEKEPEELKVQRSYNPFLIKVHKRTAPTQGRPTDDVEWQCDGNEKELQKRKLREETDTLLKEGTSQMIKCQECGKLCLRGPAFVNHRLHWCEGKNRRYSTVANLEGTLESKH